jgi:hypothetical protein
MPRDEEPRRSAGPQKRSVRSVLEWLFCDYFEIGWNLYVSRLGLVWYWLFVGLGVTAVLAALLDERTMDSALLEIFIASGVPLMIDMLVTTFWTEPRR